MISLANPTYDPDALRKNIGHIDEQIQMLRKYISDPVIEEEIMRLYADRAELTILLKQSTE